MSDKIHECLYNFWQFISKKKVEIPIIQRDYAQGRKEESEIRQNFLKSIYDAIKQDEPLNLDFIYGSVVNGSFQPIDGQQRLTTLYLLYWYIAVKENKLDDLAKGYLNNFTYETRISTRDFCNSLINKSIEYYEEMKIVELIKDSPWYFLSWGNDPSIEAMLQTISDINEMFVDESNLWNELTSSSCPITFYCIDLENFGLTDDLYIKMNARGKLLTPFENFKASFQRYILDKEWEKDRNILTHFSYKADTIWNDFFWRHQSYNNTDLIFISFISTILMMRTALRKSEKGTISDKIDMIRQLQYKPISIKSNMYTYDDYIYLCNSLDMYSNLSENILNYKPNLNLWQHKPTNYEYTPSSIIKVLPFASYTQKVIFYAQTEYLLNSEFNAEDFDDWMRVVRNIICRGDVQQNGSRQTIVRSPEAFNGVMNLLDEIKDGSHKIYKYLNENKVNSQFSRETIKEEKEKARLISLHPEYKQSIFDAEETEFCQGKIKFVLECIDYKYDGILNLEKLDEVVFTLVEYLDGEIDNDIRRGLLTISNELGNYNYYEYWWSYSHALQANKRCLIASYNELEYFVDSSNDEYKYSDYLKKYILKLTKHTPSQIIENFNPSSKMKNWQVRLIKEKDLLDDFCKSHYIAIPEDNSYCYLLKGKRPRSIDVCKKVE